LSDSEATYTDRQKCRSPTHVRYAVSRAGQEYAAH
jgi:hypothetical protein